MPVTQPVTPLTQSYTLKLATELLPLLQSIAAEVREHRTERSQLEHLAKDLEREELRHTPEGVESALTEAQFRLRELDWQLRRCSEELKTLGLSVQNQNPLTVHIPGRTRSGELVFCWEEGEGSVCYGHELGEENEPRRPLRIRA